MEGFLLSLLACTVTMSAAALLYLAARPFLAKRLTAKSRYYAWLVILIGLLLPFRPQAGYAPIQIDLPEMAPIEISTAYQEDDVLTGGICGTHSVQPVMQFPWYQALFWLWAAGGFVCLTRQLYRHARFILDPEISCILKQQRMELGMTRDVQLKRCPLTATPMLAGILKPAILLPETSFSQEELTLILRHELVHAKRGDLCYKALMMVCQSLHWFNPFMQMIRHAVDIDCEISCDEETLRDLPLSLRTQYGKTILKTASAASSAVTVFCTNFYGGVNDMKKRLNELFSMHKRHFGILTLLVVLAVCVMTGSILSFGYSVNSEGQASSTLDTGSQSTANSQNPKDQTLTYDNGISIVLDENGKWVGGGYDGGIDLNLPLAEMEKEYLALLEPFFQEYPQYRIDILNASNSPHLPGFFMKGTYSSKLAIPNVENHHVFINYNYRYDIKDRTQISSVQAEQFYDELTSILQSQLKQKDLDYFQNTKYKDILQEMGQIAANVMPDNCHIIFEESQDGVVIEEKSSLE